MVLFGDVCYKHRAVTPTDVRRLKEAPPKTATATERGKQSSMFTSVSQSCRSLLTLRWCEMMMLSFGRINASQPNNSRAVFQPAKEVLFTSSVICDIRTYARDGFLVACTVDTQNLEKSHFFEMVDMFWGWGRETVLSRIVDSKWYMGPSFWTRDKKSSIERHSPQSAWEENRREVCNSGQGQNRRLSGLWRGDYCDCDVKMRNINFQCLLQAVERTREAFHTNLVSQDFFKENLSGFCPWDLALVKISPEWVTGPEQGKSSGRICYLYPLDRHV